MENKNRTLLNGLLAALVLGLSRDQFLNTNDTNRLMLVGVLTVLTLVFSTEQLVDTIEDIASTRYVDRNAITVDSSLTTKDTLKIIQSILPRNEIESPLSKLTPREKEVFALMTKGLMNKQIASQLGVSHATVKNHVTSILRKLGAKVRTEAVAIAHKHGFVNENTNLVPNDFSYQS
jgi:DNA-binding NarL/FixJ family response regulator